MIDHCDCGGRAVPRLPSGTRPCGQTFMFHLEQLLLSRLAVHPEGHREYTPEEEAFYDAEF
jgi:hypothetical protein